MPLHTHNKEDNNRGTFEKLHTFVWNFWHSTIEINTEMIWLRSFKRVKTRPYLLARRGQHKYFSWKIIPGTIILE